MASTMKMSKLVAPLRYRASIRRRWMSTLHTAPLGGSDGDTEVVFLHGLLGNGKNLRTMATKFGSGGTLVDLRGHGQSPARDSPHTFVNCAKDVLETAVSSPPTIIVGHSFGGRVALECAMQAPIETTWLLDTVPGLANESVEKVIAAVQVVDPREYNDRKVIARVLQEEQQLDVGLALWLTSSMTKTESEGWTWGFDVSVVNDLMPEFGSQDFLGKLQHLALSEDQGLKQRVHLVRGGKNTGWTIELISKLQDLSKRSNGRFHMHTLPKAGHWVHVDDLPGMVKLWDTYHR